MVCSECLTDVPDEDVFCENCGFKFAEPEPSQDACVCGALASDADEEGFCQQCGRRVRRPASDHAEVALSADFAGVSDRGLRHERNEDRFALVEETGGFGLVVCDGVSATDHPEIASAAVSETVARSLEEVLRAGERADTEGLLVGAIASAASELNARREHDSEGENAPSTTVVSAVVADGEITVVWVGDSRAYWIDAEGATLLTRDHSWLNLALEGGELTREQAEAAPQAHAITRWIGADADGAGQPDVVRHRIASDGVLLLCTDGLWNYVPEPDAMKRLMVEAESGGGDALEAARHLVAFANEKGGRDNITVALLRVRDLQEIATVGPVPAAGDVAQGEVLTELPSEDQDGLSRDGAE